MPKSNRLHVLLGHLADKAPQNLRARLYIISPDQQKERFGGMARTAHSGCYSTRTSSCSFDRFPSSPLPYLVQSLVPATLGGALFADEAMLRCGGVGVGFQKVNNAKARWCCGLCCNCGNDRTLLVQSVSMTREHERALQTSIVYYVLMFHIVSFWCSFGLVTRTF